MELSRRNAIKSAAVVGAAATVTAGPGVASAEDQAARAGECTWTPGELQDRRRVIAAGFTEIEADCWLLVARAAGKFFAMPQIHPLFIPEVVDAIHVLQDKLLMRPTYRKYLSLTQPPTDTAYVK